MKKFAFIVISTILSGCASDRFLIEKHCESLHKLGTEGFNECVENELTAISNENRRQEQNFDPFLPTTVVPGVN